MVSTKGPSVNVNVPLVASALKTSSEFSSSPPANTRTPAAFISFTTAMEGSTRPRNHSSVWSPTHCWLK